MTRAIVADKYQLFGRSTQGRILFYAHRYDRPAHAPTVTAVWFSLFPISCIVWFVVSCAYKLLDLNNNRPHACKTEIVVTINCEFSLPRLNY